MFCRVICHHFLLSLPLLGIKSTKIPLGHLSFVYAPLIAIGVALLAIQEYKLKITILLHMSNQNGVIFLNVFLINGK